MGFYEELAKLNANLAEFTDQFETCMTSEENKTKFKDFKRETKVRVTEYSSSKQINDEKRKIVASLGDAMMFVEDAAFNDDDVAQHCEDAGCLIDMENARENIIEAYDNLQTLALIKEGKITVGDEDFVDGVNFDGESFSF